MPVLVDDLAEIETIAQQVEQVAAAEGDTAARSSPGRGCDPGPDVPGDEVAFQGMDGTKIEIGRKDLPDDGGFRLVDGERARSR